MRVSAGDIWLEEELSKSKEKEEIIMENQPVFTLVFPSSVSETDQEELFVELRKVGGVVQQETRRDLATVVLILTAVKVSMEIVKVTIDMADKIIAMRKKWQEEGKEVAGELRHPEKETLDLARASDKEVKEWITR
jgi:hypothetical protein